MGSQEGSRAGGLGAGPGLGQLGLRLGLGALLVIGALLLIQQRSEREREAAAVLPLSSGTIRLPELTARVEILRDARGIPHVLAAAEREGWFGLGFAHAQDRLAQMIWLRRSARGRRAEIHGAALLPADRLARLLAIGSAAEAAAAQLPEAARAVLEAYSAGINARLARIQRGVADAPRALAEPVADIEPWRPADSLALGKLLSWCMGGTLETTLVLDDLIRRLDSVPARPFFPGGAAVDFGISPYFQMDRPRPERDEQTHGGLPAELQPTRDLCRGIGLPTGGAWVVDGRTSQSGAPLLVADWQLEPTVPALFYEARLAAGPIEVAGVTIPGSPIVWAGRNRTLAWAGVPADAPVSDLFIETLRPDRGLYQNGSLWVPIEERWESLRWKDARGVLQESPMRIRSTRHGPLIDSLWASSAAAAHAAEEAEAAGRADGAGDGRAGGLAERASAGEPERGTGARRRPPLALAWTGARAGDGLSSMLALLTASDTQSVEDALRSHHEPVLAVVFANRAGQGGVQIAGWLPRRPLPTGLVPVQGRLRSFDWVEPVRLESLPRTRLGPGAGRWLLAVDQPWPAPGGLDQIEWLWRTGDRAARLESELARLAAERPIDLRMAADLLGDQRAQDAAAVVAAILDLARRAGPLPVEARELARLLARWDGSMGTDSVAAAAYHLVLERLLEGLLETPLGSRLFARFVQAPHVRPQDAVKRLVLRAAELRRPGGWTDEPAVARAARDSLRAAWVALNHRLGPSRDRWIWGRLHRLRFQPLGPARSLPDPLGRAMAVSGNGETLELAAHRPGVSFDVERTSVYRIAMDLAAPDRLLSALVPGQSEHPGHRHFDDGLARWRSARLSLFPTSRLVIEEESGERLVLEPAL